MDCDSEQSKGKGSLAKVHAKGISRSISSESGSGKNTSVAPILIMARPMFREPHPTMSSIASNALDELLQFKLYQAITEPDDILDGSTIVLATGDGNVGQFDEQGFFG